MCGVLSDHVLCEVRQARYVGRIVVKADADRHAGSSYERSRIADEQYGQSIGQLGVVVDARVGWRLEHLRRGRKYVACGEVVQQNCQQGSEQEDEQ